MARQTIPSGVRAQTESSRIPYRHPRARSRAFAGLMVAGTGVGLPTRHIVTRRPLDPYEGATSAHPSINDTVQYRRTLVEWVVPFRNIIDPPAPTTLDPVGLKPGRRWFAQTLRREYGQLSQRFLGTAGSPVLAAGARMSRGTMLPARQQRLTKRDLPQSFSSRTEVLNRGGGG